MTELTDFPVASLDTETISEEGLARLICIWRPDKQYAVIPFNAGDVIEALKVFKPRFSQCMFYLCWNSIYDFQAIAKWFFPIRPLKSRGWFKSYRYPVKFFVSDKVQIMKWRKVRIYFIDAFRFYGSSLDKAGKEYLGEGKLDYNVKELKLSDFKASNKALIEYCMKDAELCYRLYELPVSYTHLTLPTN